MSQNRGDCVIRVTVPLTLPKPLDYLWTAATTPKIGDFVDVTVMNKQVHAVVSALPAASDVPAAKLKPALPVPHAPRLAPQNHTFWQWVAGYTLHGLGQVLRAVLIAGQVPSPPPAQTVITRGGVTPPRLTASRQRVLELAAVHSFLTQSALAAAAGVSVGVVQGLLKNGALAQVAATHPPAAPAAKKISFSLNPAQQQAAQAIGAAEGFAPFLLDGVMGSGKTEVYFSVIEHLLAQSATAQALVLVPEIALTPQWLHRFEHRFGFAPLVWHSKIAHRARMQGWHDAATGRARVIVGARSALFLPYKNIKLVVVDEEHDPSYKQEDDFRYHGRDMAIALAKTWGCPVVLASATPSLESWHNAQNGRYTLLNLPQRHGERPLAAVTLCNLREHPPAEKDHWLGAELRKVVLENFAQQGQTLLYLNRRGTAPLLLCRGCGHRFDCPSCTASLVVHGGVMQCHHCGYSLHRPKTCPSCTSDKLVAWGPGTRKVAAEVQALLPTARIAIADSDAIHDVADMGTLVTRMEAGEIDVLVGTQMVTKGHHFPGLTLVGVIDGDMGLARGDLRAAERTFQLLLQVAGRAGRGDSPGRVLVQTHQPQHPLFQALKAYNREDFWQLELRERQQWGFPPFGRLSAIILSGYEESAVQEAGRLLLASAPSDGSVQVLGPAPAPLARLRDRHRYRLLVKSTGLHHTALSKWLAATRIPARVRLDVDVDPVNFS